MVQKFQTLEVTKLLRLKPQLSPLWSYKAERLHKILDLPCRSNKAWRENFLIRIAKLTETVDSAHKTLYFRLNLVPHRGHSITSMPNALPQALQYTIHFLVSFMP